MIEETAIRSMLMEMDVPPHKLDVSKPDTTKWLLDNLRVRNQRHVMYVPTMKALVALAAHKLWTKKTKLAAYTEHVERVVLGVELAAKSANIKLVTVKAARVSGPPSYANLPKDGPYTRAVTERERNTIVMVPSRSQDPNARVTITMTKVRPVGSGQMHIDMPYGNGPRRQRGRINEEATAVRLEEELNRKT